MPSKHLSRFLTVRLDASDHQVFREKAEFYDGTSMVLRELIKAFIEDRLVIKPPVNRKELFNYE